MLLINDDDDDDDEDDNNDDDELLAWNGRQILFPEELELTKGNYNTLSIPRLSRGFKNVANKVTLAIVFFSIRSSKTFWFFTVVTWSDWTTIFLTKTRQKK